MYANYLLEAELGRMSVQDIERRLARARLSLQPDRKSEDSAGRWMPRSERRLAEARRNARERDLAA